MIISYSKKIMFFRSPKTASSSLRSALVPYLSPQDRYADTDPYDINLDNTHYDDFYEQNTILPLSNIKIERHTSIEEIKESADFKDTWATFYKFTTIRNPWDLMISYIYWFDSRVGKNLLQPIHYQNNNWSIKRLVAFLLIYIPTFIQYLIDIIQRENKLAKRRREVSINIYFLFVRYILRNYIGKQITHSEHQDYINVAIHLIKTALYKNKPILDFYLRYENLEKDYKILCQKINIPYKPLPKLKTKPRQNVKHIHYSKYYTPITRYMVQYMFRYYIKAFRYKFEKNS